MGMRSRGHTPRLTVVLLALAGLLVAAAPSSADSIRAQIKEAKNDLIAFEKDLNRVVSSFDGLQRDLEVVEAEITSLRTLLRRSGELDSFYERALTDLVIRPLAERQLADAKERAAVIEALLPGLRREIWNRGLEREEKIETLDNAIELLESTQSGELVTRAGLGGGKLITYSADWAAVAQCESSGRWHINVGLFDGGLQFLPSTWWGFGGGEYAQFAYQATKRQQIDIAERVLAVQGPEAWPNCFEPLPVDTDE